MTRRQPSFGACHLIRDAVYTIPSAAVDAMQLQVFGWPRIAGRLHSVAAAELVGGL
jgi:hypothetical protein